MDSRAGSLLEFEYVDNEVKERTGFEMGGGNLEGFELCRQRRKAELVERARMEGGV